MENLKVLDIDLSHNKINNLSEKIVNFKNNNKIEKLCLDFSGNYV